MLPFSGTEAWARAEAGFLSAQQLPATWTFGLSPSCGLAELPSVGSRLQSLGVSERVPVSLRAPDSLPSGAPGLRSDLSRVGTGSRL